MPDEQREASLAKAEEILSSQPEEARIGDVILAWSMDDVPKGVSPNIAELAQLTRRVDNWFKQILADALQRERDEALLEAENITKRAMKAYLDMAQIASQEATSLQLHDRAEGAEGVMKLIENLRR